MTEEMFQAYVACALWTSSGSDGDPLDDVYDVSDLSEETSAQMRAECADFLDLLRRQGVDHSVVDASQMGHDFWLTRNGHGAGFWDRGLGVLGDQLTDAAKSFSEVNLYVGDDGQVHQE